MWEYRVICHDGQKDQKWYRRLFQYANRRWTPLGKIRYGHGSIDNIPQDTLDAGAKYVDNSIRQVTGAEARALKREVEQNIRQAKREARATIRETERNIRQAKREAKRLEKADDRWVKKNQSRIERQAERESRKEIKKYEKELAKQMPTKRKDGKEAAAYVNKINQYMAKVMSAKITDIQTPSGRSVMFVAKRSERGVYMAMYDKGYDVSKLKKGVRSDGKIAYRKENVSFDYGRF